MPDVPKVFISYAHEEGLDDRVLALADRLRADGVDVQLDQYETSPPEGWPRWMDRWIRDADFVLMICTERYYRRVMGEEEPGKGYGVRWEGNLIYQHLYDAGSLNRRFIPVILEPGSTDHIPAPTKGGTYHAIRRFDFDDPGYEGLYRRLTNQPKTRKPEPGRLRALPQRPRRTDFSGAGRLWAVPHTQNPYFTGRDDLLERLHAALLNETVAGLTQPQTISGLGGIGKTQTAVEYCCRYAPEYRFVLWVQADSEAALDTGYAALAKLLDLYGEKPDEIRYSVKRWLQDTDGSLLVLDNADDPQMLRPFLPTAHRGHILITSRATDFAALTLPAPLEVPVLPEEDAVAFLLKRAGRPDPDGAERDAAEALARDLGALPLALEQAGAYIATRACSFRDYRNSYRKRRLQLLEKQRPQAGGYDQSVATTWSLNFESVQQESEAAADLLRVSAFLAPERIPHEILVQGTPELGPALAAALEDAAEDPLLLHDILEVPARYSLIRRDPEGGTYDVHRMVQEVLRSGMPEEEQRQWAERAVNALSRVFPDVEFQNWPACERLVAHALVCMPLIERCGLDSPDVVLLLARSGLYLQLAGRYAEADPLSRRALATCEKALGPEHLVTAASLNNMALLYQHQGTYAQAEPLYQRALAIREKALGPEHPHTAISLNNLAGLYQNEGRYADAEPLCQRALAICEKVLGPEHSDTANTLNNLAGIYNRQKRYADAEPLYQRALAMSERALGSEHPQTATHLNNLAGLYDEQGRYADAEQLHQRALAIRKKALGPDHPSTANSLNNLAWLYNRQGKCAHAQPLFRRALEICEKALGPEHPHTADVCQNYAGCLRRMGLKREAQDLEKRAREIRSAHERRNTQA
ncbi:MAG: toll/interleukin-1 receptor domain-containing protein [Armatimonadetes bacterium]|nr:toll/interleukin-1 receptor domain-containing protein [Armatimonadota bacterium]